MTSRSIRLFAATSLIAVVAWGASLWATDQVGPSGKTYASATARCAVAPATGLSAPTVQVGLLDPKRNATAEVFLNGTRVATVSSTNPASDVWLADNTNTVAVVLNKRTADTYTFLVAPGMCTLPDTSGNTFSPDGTLEYAASGKSYATVTPGCALNAATNLAQPYVHLVDNGNYVLNVSVNGEPLTQLSATRPHTPVFLRAGLNVISAANGTLSVDYYVRDGGDGICTLP